MSGEHHGVGALNQGNSKAAWAAVTTILDNIILHLERYDLVKAQTLAEVLGRDRMPQPSLFFNVLHAAALTATLQRGRDQIRLHAQKTALVEFQRARAIWSTDPHSVRTGEPVHKLAHEEGTGTRGSGWQQRGEPRIAVELSGTLRIRGLPAG